MWSGVDTHSDVERKNAGKQKIFAYAGLIYAALW